MASIIFRGDYRGYARVGFGLEYSRDFFRLSANTYFRVTDWKESPDLIEYNERPANGWDVRARAWLPNLPQLGGRLFFEQYYGNEVALFGNSTRSKNPTAITAGLEYSPFPLVTFSVERTQASSNEFDNVFSVSVNYELGVPWSQQIDPATLEKARSLEHSRYELVDRNNNIVLEYKKQTLITIKMTENITGYPGETKPLLVIVKSKYGHETSKISIKADASLEANGGALIREDATHYSVKIPNWSDTGSNIYTITGTAVDKKGNESNTAKSQVIVKEVMDASNSTFEPEDSKIVANNKDTQTLTLTLKNSAGKLQNVSIDDIIINKTFNDASDATVSNLVRKGTGVFVITVKAGNEEGSVTLSPLVQNVELKKSATVELTSKIPVAEESSIINASVSGSDAPILANDSDYAIIKVTLVNNKGVRISNAGSALDIGFNDGNSGVAFRSALLAATTAGAKISAITDHGDGTYTARMTATAKGTYQIIPKYNGMQIGSLSVSVKAVAVPNASNSIFSATTPIRADGSDTSTLTVTMNDYSGAPVAVDSSKIAITIYNSRGGVVSRPSVSASNSTGVYNATFTTINSGTYTARATYSGAAVGSAQTITANGVVDISKSVISVSPASIEANNSATSTITVAMKDYAGSPINVTDSENIIVKVRNNFTGVTENLTATATGGTGSYSASFKTTVAGEYTVTATYNGNAVGVGNNASKAIRATQAVSAARSTLTVSNASINANNSDSSIITIELKDYNDDAVDGNNLRLTINGAAVTPVKDIIITGKYTYTFKTTVSGEHKVVATYGGTAINGSPKTINATAVVSADRSTLTVSPTSIDADGVSTSKIRVQLKDYNGGNIDGEAEKLKLTSNGANITANKVGTGLYTYDFTTTTSGSYAIVATYNNDDIGKATITANVKVSPTHSTLSVSQTSINANNIDSSTITISLKNYSGGSIDSTGSNLKLTINGENITPTKISTGVYTYTFKTTVSGEHKVVATYGGTAINDSPKTINATAVVSAERSTLTVSPTSIVADGNSTSTITLTLLDYAGRPISVDAGNITITTNNTASGAITKVSTNANETKATLTSTTTSGINTITAVAGGVEISAKPTIETTRAISPTQSTLTVSKDTIPADGGQSSSIITLTLRDYAGQLVETSNISITTNNGAYGTITKDSTNGGVTTATLKSTTQEGVNTITAVANGVTITAKPTIKTVATVSPARSTLTVSPTSIVADGNSTSTITLTLLDYAGRPISVDAANITITTDNNAYV